MPDLVAAVQHEAPPSVVEGTDVVLDEAPTLIVETSPSDAVLAAAQEAQRMWPGAILPAQALIDAANVYVATTATVDHAHSMVLAKLSEVVAYLKGKL
jgi:hypothetical protein